MNWNDSIKVGVGVIVGAAVGAAAITLVQSAGAPFDLDTLGKIGAAVVAPLTLGLVAFTGVLARETRQMWVQNRAPHVIVTIEPTPDHFYWMELVVENVGGGPAFDVVATVAPDIVRNVSRPIRVSESSLLKLPVLKPKQRIATFVGEWMNMEPKHTVVRCTCKDASGDQHVFTNEIDLEAYTTMISHGDTPIEKIAKEVEKISRSLSRRLEVNTHNATDRAAEEAELERRYEQLTQQRKLPGSTK